MNVRQTFVPESTVGIVKWYDSAKGYGFATSAQLDLDILIHKNVLEAANVTSVVEGATVTLSCIQTDGRIRATAISKIEPPAHLNDTKIDDGADVSSKVKPARVKWFDPQKGYGFVNQFGQIGDIFLGRDALNRSGLQSVETGEAISVQIAMLDGKPRVHRLHSWNH